MRTIDIPQASPVASGSAPLNTQDSASRLTTVDMRSYQIYDLSDGRLGARYRDNKVTVPLTHVESNESVTGPTTPSHDDPFGPDVAEIMAGYSPDEPPVEHQIKKKRARPELRAAVRQLYLAASPDE